TLEFLLTFRTRVHCLCEKGFKIVDVKVDMNRRPVSLISANFVSPLGRFAPSRFLDQSDLRATFENDIGRHRSADLGKSQGVAIKSQAFIEQRTSIETEYFMLSAPGRGLGGSKPTTNGFRAHSGPSRGDP